MRCGPHHCGLGSLVLELRRTGWLALLVGVALVAGLHAGRLGGIPIYDGLVLPQNYRYVSPPPNLRSSNQPPLSGEASFSIQNGQVVGGGVQTGDNQVLVFFGVGGLKASPGAQSVRVQVEPVTDPPSRPPGAEIRGNVYRITAVELPSGAPVGVAEQYHITMAFPPGPFQEFQVYDGTEWHAVKTNRVSGYQFAGANLTILGEVAATAPAGKRENIFTVLARLVEAYGLLAFVILFGIIAIAQEIRRRRKRA